MSLIVQKFGGSSVRDYAHLLRMARIVKSRVDEGDDVVVVLSAQGDTTDDLIAKAEEINPHASKREMDMLLSSGEQISAALLAMGCHLCRSCQTGRCCWGIATQLSLIHI